MTTDLLLSQATDGFLLSRLADGYSPKTIEQYKWGMAYFIKSSGDKQLSEITKTDIRTLLAGLRGGHLGDVSIFHVWKAVRSFYKWASVELQVPRPDLDIKAPAHVYPEVIPFTQDEIKRLIRATERTKPSEGKKPGFTMKRVSADRDKAIILTLLDTGIRAGELSRLKMSDMDLEAGTIQVRPFGASIKSRPRVIPIGQATRKALWKYTTTRERNERDPILFITNNGGELDNSDLLHLLVRLGERAGVANVHPHRLRHTFAIIFLRNGGDVFTLQRLLGHSDLTMTRHYLALAQSDDETAHRRASPVDNWKL